MYKSFNTIIIRIPLFPFHLLKYYLSEENCCAILNDKLVSEAIFFASPELYGEFKKISKNGLLNDNRKILLALTRYYSRMCTRCTPFGLFAGCVIAKLGQESCIKISNKLSRITRFDMSFLYLLYQNIVEANRTKDQLMYKMNSSIYETKNSYRYIKYHYSIEKDRRIYQVSSVKKYHFLNKLYKYARNERNIDDLVSLIKDNFETEEYAKELINELIDNHILVDTMAPNTIGTDAFTSLAAKVSAINPNSDVSYFLERLNNSLHWINENLDENERVGKCQEIIKEIKNWGIQFDEKYLFQVDSYRNTITSTISKRVIRELKSTISFLNRITNKIDNVNLNEFKEAFYRRYESKEVPLLIVLDPELGIGYPLNQNKRNIDSPLLKDLKLPTKNGTMNFDLGRNEKIILDKIFDSLRNNQREIELTDDDFPNSEDNFNELPETMFVLFELLRDENSELSIKLNSTGSSAANMISRFSHLDSQIEDLVQDIAKFEQKYMNNVILAEIVHLPNDRVGNILAAPHTRDFEIVYLANSDSDNKKTILASDIWISVKNNKISLRSKTLNKYIIPRLSNAHNYLNSEIPFYRLLCDLQSYDRKDLFSNFNFLDRLLKYKPRINYGNTILSPETWIINVKDLFSFVSLNDSNVGLWRKKNSIPRYVLLSDADNNLFVDLESKLSLDSFFSIIKGRDYIRLCEFIFYEDKAVVRDVSSEAYKNECIVTLYKD